MPKKRKGKITDLKCSSEHREDGAKRKRWPGYQCGQYVILVVRSFFCWCYGHKLISDAMIEVV